VFSTEAHVKTSTKWIISVLIVVFIVSMVFGFISSEFIPSMPLWLSLALLAGMVLVNVVSDIIGIAVTTGTEVPFHSMSTHRIKGAQQSIWLIQNAEKVSNVCCDVIGDIAGIISGVAASTIVMMLAVENGTETVWFSTALTSIVSALTVGGKAIGKGVAIANSNQIIYIVGRIIHIFGFGVKKKR